MARTYKRDARGRFASGGSSTSSSGSKSKPLKRGRVQLAEARRKVRTAKGKLAAIDPADQTIKSSLSKRAQRGAVTKAEKRLTAVKRTAVIKGRRMTGTIAKPKGLKPGALKGKGVAVKGNVGVTKRETSARPRRQTRQQRSDAFIERIRKVGEGRTGTKARRAERVRQRAESFAEGLARYHKRNKPKTRQELRKGLSEAFSDRKRINAYAKFVRQTRIDRRPQSGKQSLIRPGQIDRAKERLARTQAAIMAPFSRWNPNPARQDNNINRRSAQILDRASAWYRGIRPSGKAQPLPKAPVMSSTSSKAPTSSKVSTAPVKRRGRTRKQAAAAYRLKTNQLGKEMAARLGFSAALQRGQRGGFVDSAPRRIFRRGKHRQMTLTGGVETVRTGKIREVGRRDSAGRVVLTSRRSRRRR